MIYGNSNDPVLVKKIYLKIWSLRAEIENVIKLKTLNGNPPTQEQLQEIYDEYKKKDKPHLKLVKQAPAEEGEPSQEQSGDDLEAEMAAALENGDAGEEEASEGEESGDDLEAQMAAALEESGDGGEASEESSSPTGPVSVIQRGSHTIPEDQIIKGMTILSEVGIDKIHFFSQVPFLEGQSIVLEFQIPQRFVVNADIHYCRPFNISSRIISSNRLPFRVVANFTFLKEGERTLLRNFIESIEPEVPTVVELKPQKSDDGDSDEFDDLDGLDF